MRGSIARLSRVLGYGVKTDEVRHRLRLVLDSPSDLIVVAVRSARTVVGWLQAHASLIVESGFRVEITGLVVSPSSRRRGVGRALIAEAERWATAMLAEAIVVRSNVKRLESHAFYPALGYRQTKMQKVYRKVLPESSF